MIEQGTLVAIVTAAAGAVSTWGVLGWRVRSLENRAAEVAELRKVVDGLSATFSDVRTDQGRRIGEAKSAVDQLAGRLAGFEAGFVAGRARSKTAVPQVIE